MNNEESIKIVVDSLVTHCIRVIESTIPLIDRNKNIVNAKKWAMEELIKELTKNNIPT